MATLKQATDAGLLEVFDVPEWEQRPPVRPLWVAAELMDWAYETPELNDMAIGRGRRTLCEHMLQLFCDFCCDLRVHYSDLKRMLPTSGGVWHMYPPGLRIYGWVPRPNAFVAVAGALVGETKSDPRLNDRKRDEVIAFAQRAGLVHTIQLGDFLDLFPPPG